MRRLVCGLLALAVLFGMAGCAAMFDREYYVIEEYEAPSEPSEAEEDAAADTISNYAALRRAIVRLVSAHTESAQLQFQNYDGAISQDISTACWEVKSSTALGAFAVDYISYDLSRIVSYYQAEIFITYKRAAWQVDAIEKIANAAALSARVERALREDETYLVLEISSAAVAGDTALAAAERAYYADPLACPVLPAVETNVFPDSGVDRILEISLDYGMDTEALSVRRAELEEALSALSEALSDEDAADDERLRGLCDYLISVCEISADAPATAWDALVQGAASSEGTAMAFVAGCRALGFDAVAVSGRLNGEPHFWNIVTLGGASYHVDISVPEGEEPVFLLGDEALLSRGYWWDNSDYPACAGSYSDEAGDASGEPGASEEVLPE